MLRAVYHASDKPCKVYFATHSERPAPESPTFDPIIAEVLTRAAELTRQGLDAGDALLTWLIERAGGFIPAETLIATLGWSQRTTFRHLARIKPFVSRANKDQKPARAKSTPAPNPAPQLAHPVTTASAAEVATAREESVSATYMPKLTEEQTDRDNMVPKVGKALSLETDSPHKPVCQLTAMEIPSQQTSVPNVQPLLPSCPGTLFREIRELSRQWRMPNLVRTLPNLLGMVVAEHGGEYVPGALTEAAVITDETWRRGRVYTSKAGYLVGVFRNLLPEALADITTLRRTKELLDIVGAEPEDAELRLWDEIESRLWKAGAHRLAAQAVAHELLPERFWPPIKETIQRLTHIVGYGVHGNQPAAAAVV